MGNINFYDWRTEKKEETAKINQAFLFLCLVFAVALCFALFMGKNKELEKNIAAKKYIEKQEEIMENTKKEIESIKDSKKLIIEKINVIKDLQKERPILVYSLDELTTSIPENVYLTSLSREEQNITLKGIALSNSDIGVFIENIENTKTFDSPKIVDIKKIKKEGYLDSAQFNIVANIDISNENVINEGE